jgi:hypothetical protein
VAEFLGEFEFSGAASLAILKGAIPVIYSSMSWFYEIRGSTNAVLKRDGGFADVDAEKSAARADAKKMKNSHQPGVPDVGRIMVGQNKEVATRY